MAKCGERCRKCDYYDWEMNGCGYRTRTDLPRGILVESRYGKHYVYPEPCDKFEPIRDELQRRYYNAYRRRLNRPRQTLKAFPERDRLYAEGLTDYQMAKALGVKQSTIMSWREKRGLKPNKKKEENK